MNYKDVIRDDDEEMILEEEKKQQSFTVFTLLMIPLLFIAGWIANDFFTRNMNDQEFGVGAGPGNIFTDPITPQPTFILEPTEVSVPTSSAKPTNTPEPTNTPARTSTPVPTTSPEVE